MHSAFTELSIVIVVATLIAMLMRFLRQPLIIGHIITGILVGPTVLNLVHSVETIEVFANFGIALLLFIVGLGLNPKEIKEVGKVSIITGLGQVIFTSFIGFLIVIALGYSQTEAIYISIALTFSSTIIILKLLTDKKEHNKLFGRIAIGFLLVQDIIATFALLVASASGSGGLEVGDLVALALKGFGVVVGMVIVVKFILKPMTNFLSRSQEMLFLFAIAWGFGIAAITLEGGFSLEIGALFAGVALSTMPYAQEVSSRLRPLRDFFIVVFFVALGAQLDIFGIGPVFWQAIGLSAFVLIGNPIIVMVLMGLLSYTKKTSFKAGLTVAQISEFSLIFILLGLRNGHVSQSVVSLVTIVGIITIAISSYFIIYSDQLYDFIEKYLGIFERKKGLHFETNSKNAYQLVLFGYQKGGHEFLKVFKQLKKKYVIVDYDPDALDILDHHKAHYIYGDALDIELLEEIGLDKAKLIVSTISDYETNVFLLKLIEKINPGAVTIMHAETAVQAEDLYEIGASYVMMPHYIGSEKISSMIKKSDLKKSEFKQLKDKHISYLKEHYDWTFPE